MTGSKRVDHWTSGTACECSEITGSPQYADHFISYEGNVLSILVPNGVEVNEVSKKKAKIYMLSSSWIWGLVVKYMLDSMGTISANVYLTTAKKETGEK
jgi:hypothetical protein